MQRVHYSNRLQREWMREEYTTLEPSRALISALSDVLSLHTNLNTRLRIVDWQHWVLVKVLSLIYCPTRETMMNSTDYFAINMELVEHRFQDYPGSAEFIHGSEYEIYLAISEFLCWTFHFFTFLYILWLLCVKLAMDTSVNSSINYASLNSSFIKLSEKNYIKTLTVMASDQSLTDNSGI